MINVNDLYKAEASSFIHLATTGYNAVAGFRVPEYQREYNWSKDNITRLYTDTLNGLARLHNSSSANPALTFLGTVILVRETSKEPEFSGESLAVVDGQQRLTTLALFSCALVETLRRVRNSADLSDLDRPVTDWLTAEIDHRLEALCTCVLGMQPVSFNQSYPFPRIVRIIDTRGNSPHTAEYRSPVGTFLHRFGKYYAADADDFIVDPHSDSGATEDRLRDNYETIRQLVGTLSEPVWYEDTECEMFDVDRITHRYCRGLLERLPDHFRDEHRRQQALEQARNLPSLHALLRTLAFGSYFCNYMVLTRVTTEDEAAAFDIFDSLNTTGEPLTALETLRPRAIHYENADIGTRRGYAGSDSERAFSTVRKYIDQRITNSGPRQREAKELVVTFALYSAGEKRSRDLADQRNFLRLKFDESTTTGEANTRRFLQMIADVTMFRRFYWDAKAIQDELYEFHGTETLDEIRLLVSFIHSMGTSLALPIIARYWQPALKQAGDSDFLAALRAVAAFIVLRRAATGGTAGIDSDLRKVMSGVQIDDAEPALCLCAGVGEPSSLLTLKELRNVLHHLLRTKLGEVLERDTWIEVVSRKPLYSSSRPLVRLMLLAAAHKSQASDTVPGTWHRDGVRAAVNDREFLNYTSWTAEEYATVEHVAPATKSDGWGSDLYEDSDLRHCLGNLVLLPREENSSIGNVLWEKKRLFYLALTERTDAAQQERLGEAESAGIAFGKNTIALLSRVKRLPLLDSVRDVEAWDLDLVIRRSKNTAELCWEEMSGWLAPDSSN